MKTLVSSLVCVGMRQRDQTVRKKGNKKVDGGERGGTEEPC